MPQPLNDLSLNMRRHFFRALRTLSLQDQDTARITRQLEYEVQQVLFQIEGFVREYEHLGGDAEGAARRIARQWLAMADQCLDVDADLADVLLLLARHWALGQVAGQDVGAWVDRVGVLVQLSGWRSERRPSDGHSGALSELRHANRGPRLGLMLRGLPRGVSPLEVEVELTDGAVLGRASDSDWVLPGETVSRHHARFRFDRNTRTFFVRDLSRNGISVVNSDGSRERPLDRFSENGVAPKPPPAAEGSVAARFRDRVAQAILPRSTGALDDSEAEEEREYSLAVGSTLYVPLQGDYEIFVQSVFVPAQDASAVELAPEDPATEPAPTTEDLEAYIASFQPSADVVDISSARRDGAEHGATVAVQTTGDPIVDVLAPIPRISDTLVTAARDYVWGRIQADALINPLFADLIESS